ncbi:AbrB/MazE/SpoVT family DNA-binding domain-containing protein [Paenisporosarcina sp. TG-14]|uniref:AbrB/MazE/SpoVT family DNA-binding domain-containing protein n=1 Tax=Paenisporosarcina sp. TG-14 TaxID=1231057 RepID=UPI0003199437|nr:AbrB/MazE/SpoVT family DNA-binding domain-containing protein [Paenisporosarcina sp. TG-14]
MKKNQREREVRSVTTTVQKWGNSLAIRIPAGVAEQFDIQQGCEMDMTVGLQGFTLVPKKRKPTLEELLSKCTPENRHEEIKFGVVGKELF